MTKPTTARLTMLCLGAALALTGCAGIDRHAAGAANSATGLSDWPHITSAISKSPDDEARIARIVAGMSLAQKVGQMTQPEIKSISPAQVRQYYIGSVLNGGGSWPNKNKHASAADWVALADRYYDASMSTDVAVKVPVIWGIDAIHGNSNVYGATLFPHNIGLGAAHDAALVGEIGAAVGKAVRATGIHWVFAPTLAAVRDDRWGRTYESFSEDGALVNTYAGAYVKGLQGSFADPANVVATAKHFMGDGGTDQGVDQGVTKASKAEMINIHGQGYYGALAAGAQTVMASFNSWNDVAAGVDYGKMHGSKALLTDMLKHKLGFDGFVVSDWNGIAQVPGCKDASCPQAINAGIDMVMVPDDWQAFIANTIAEVDSGKIPLARIDDAVTRILRVKMRAGLFDQKPSQSVHAGRQEALQARALARQAVQESLVLLKNNGQVLPLARGKKILVVGKSADSLPNQTGGWTLTWQGTENQNSDFPNGDTLLAGIRAAAGGGNVVFSEKAGGVDVGAFDAVIAVIGETPYAEGAGDIPASATLHHASRYPEDLAVLKAVAGKGKPVITVFLSGRPLYVNDLLNLSDAFVAAWLPGSEGKGVADVLFRNAAGTIAKDFRGSLSFSWPKSACQTPLNFGDANYAPLFPLGYGLKYADAAPLGQLATDARLPEGGCGGVLVLPVFNQSERPPYTLYVSSAAINWVDVPIGADLNDTLNLPEANPSIRVQTAQVNIQQDAKLVTWFGAGQVFARSPQKVNLRAYAQTKGALQFDVMVHQLPQGTVRVAMDCGYPCRGTLDLTAVFKQIGSGVKRTVKIPLACFAAKGTDLSKVDTPFNVSTTGQFSAAFTKIQVVAGAAGDFDALKCGDFDSALK